MRFGQNHGHIITFHIGSVHGPSLNPYIDIGIYIDMWTNSNSCPGRRTNPGYLNDREYEMQKWNPMAMGSVKPNLGSFIFLLFVF